MMTIIIMSGIHHTKGDLPFNIMNHLIILTLPTTGIRQYLCTIDILPYRIDTMKESIRFLVVDMNHLLTDINNPIPILTQLNFS